MGKILRKTVYVTSDGKEFEYEHLAMSHEKSLTNDGIEDKILNEQTIFYGGDSFYVLKNRQDWDVFMENICIPEVFGSPLNCPEEFPVVVRKSGLKLQFFDTHSYHMNVIQEIYKKVLGW